MNYVTRRRKCKGQNDTKSEQKNSFEQDVGHGVAAFPAMGTAEVQLPGVGESCPRALVTGALVSG